MSHVVTVPELLDGHTVLDIECLDRVYLSGYVPTLQVGGQVFTFLHDHRGMPVASPAVFGQISGRFRQAVDRFAQMNDIPVVKFKRGIRKLDVMQRYLRAAARADRPGVAAIGRAEEFQLVWDARQRDSDPSKPPQFFFVKAERRVTCYYFYVRDEDFGPAFIKVCAYFPYPAKIWVNGHEWAKRQAARAGIAFTELPADSPLVRTPVRCRKSAAGCSPAPSRCSPSGGCTVSRCPSAAPTSGPGTGGRSPCARSRSPAPWCSTRPAGPAASSRR